jgi:hypothetical protein
VRSRAGVVIGVVALVIGLLWVGQGLGFIGGSVMSGARQWFYIGLVLALVGVVLLVRSARRRPQSR